MRKWHEPVDNFRQFDNNAFLYHPDDGAFGRRLGLVGVAQSVPWIIHRLLVSERNPAVLLVDVEHNDIDFVSLFQHLSRVPYFLGPGEV